MTHDSTPATPDTRSTGPSLLTAGQEAALARLGCVATEPGAVAVLCGPAGAGTTTVVRHLVAALQARHSIEHAPAAWWQSRADAAWPDVAIVDDAHDTTSGDLGRLLVRARSLRPDGGVVLAGRGRLLTLLAREPDAEAAITLRAVLRSFTAVETRTLLARHLHAPAPTAAVLAVAADIHELAGGLPAVALRLGELAGWLAAAHPERPLRAADIETLHRRVSLAAA